MRLEKIKLFTIIVLPLFMVFCGEGVKKMEYSYGKKYDSIEALIEKINAVDTEQQKQKIVDDYLQTVKSEYPLFKNDTTVVFLYNGDVDSVGVIGDMTNWTYAKQMKRIEGTNLFYLEDSYEPDARLEYWLQFGKDDFPATDPLNPYKVLNGFGEIAELAMPKYDRHKYFEKYIHGEKGEFPSVKEHIHTSKILGYDHSVHVYLPVNYRNDKEYPVVYFQDGIDYIEFAVVPHILNSMIKEGLIEDVIAVFVTPPNRFKPEVPNRMTEYGLNDDYVKFFTEELVPFIDSEYSTIKQADKRLVIGDSYGGLISAYIAFSRPDVFKYAYSQSGYQSCFKDKLINSYKDSPKKDIKLYVDSGTYERNVGASFLPADETDFLEANRRLKKVLEDKGYEFVYHEYPQGHTWGNWRRHLIDGLQYFFGKK